MGADATGGWIVEQTTIVYGHSSKVATPSGIDLGTVSHVVMDRKTGRLSHIVIHRGRVSSKHVLAPVDTIRQDDEGRLVLTGVDPEELPDLTTESLTLAERTPGPLHGTHYVQSHEVSGVGPSPGAATTRVRKVERMNLPEGSVALKTNAEVTSHDGEHIGKLTGVVSNQAENSTDSLLITTGVVSRETRSLPAHRIADVSESEIILMPTEPIPKASGENG
jgi:sporulation protein YlmC with PRC-barrel domain